MTQIGYVCNKSLEAEIDSSLIYTHFSPGVELFIRFPRPTSCHPDGARRQPGRSRTSNYCFTLEQDRCPEAPDMLWVVFVLFGS